VNNAFTDVKHAIEGGFTNQLVMTVWRHILKRGLGDFREKTGTTCLLGASTVEEMEIDCFFRIHSFCALRIIFLSSCRV
jgi:hypothetical protein